MVIDSLAHTPAGEVRAYFCAEVEETVAALAHSGAMAAAPALSNASAPSWSKTKVVLQSWATLPEQSQLIENVVARLAEIALALWPFWYGQTTANAFSPLPASLNVASLLPNQVKPRQAIATRWLKTAALACHAGQLPLAPGFTRGQQLSQLALAIDPDKLLILLAVYERQPQPYRLLGLARTATWMATSTAARVAVFAPATLAAHPELASIGYNAITIVPPTPPAPIDETNKAAIWPIAGRPHPFSPGEQVLAIHLAQDTELATLFQHNVLVKTDCNSSYWVDLLWRAGRLVVEIDGYRTHSSRTAFCQDRQRDYELLLSGYRVLRLPHDDVMADVSAALTKIRNIVHSLKIK